MTEHERNTQVADRICQELEFNGQSFQIGQYAALLDGRVVGTAQSLADAMELLDRLSGDPNRGMIVEVGPTPIDVIR